MKTGKILLAIMIVLIIGVIAGDRLYVSKFKQEFLELEKQRIVTSNKLATAKIVYENLNHVRDLVFKNMDFPGQQDTVSHETRFFDFMTTCINDLKLTLLSVQPKRPRTSGRVTTYSYKVKIEGDFFKFGELCAKIENSRRITSLETYKVTLKDKKEKRYGGPDSKIIEVDFEVDTYRIKKAAADADSVAQVKS